MLAVWLQLAAVPLANAHMLERSLTERGAQLITICTAQGATSLLVDENGQPVKSKPGVWTHCPICFTAGSSPLVGTTPVLGAPLAVALVVYGPLASHLSGPDAGLFWPWSHGPPA